MSELLDVPGAEEPWPDGVYYRSPQVYEFQIDGIVEATVTGSRVAVWDMGCIYGDAEITVNRAGISRRMKLSHVVKMFRHGKAVNGHRWDPDIPTYVQREQNGVVRLARLINAWESGVKQTYTVTTNTGRTIRTTDEHPFLTERGWLRLDELVPGDEVHVRGQRSSKGREKKAYLYTSWLRHHPHATHHAAKKSPYRVATHRIVAEAQLNELSLDVFVKRVRTGEVSGLQFLDPEIWAVHHLDHDYLNNDPDNLQVMTHDEHRIYHAEARNTSNLMIRTTTESVVSIEPYGEEETFDIEVADDPHNFLADGFVVHNTGKSHLALGTAGMCFAEGLIDYVLVVAEKNKLWEWGNDFGRFTRLERVIYHGPKRKKRLADAPGAQVLITTYETLRNDAVVFTLKRRKKTPDDGPLLDHLRSKGRLLIVYDECTKLRNRSSQTYKAHAHVLRKLRKTPTPPRILGLTGTPVERDLGQAFNMLRLLVPDRMPTVEDFDREFVRFYDMHDRPKWKPDAPERFAELAGPVLMRKRKTDPDVIAQFPKRVEEVRYVELHPEHRELYQMIESLGWDSDTNKPIEVPGLLQVLRQCAGHPGALAFGRSQIARELTDRLGAEYLMGLPAAKAQALAELLVQLVYGQGEKAVVFTTFGQSVLQVLRGDLEAAGFTVYAVHGGQGATAQANNVQAFRQTSQPCVLLSSDAGARGVNLPEATYCIEYESAITHAMRSQRLDRIHRIDSKAPSVTCMTLVAQNTLEEVMVGLMLGRNFEQDKLLHDDEAEGFFTAAQRRLLFTASRTRKDP